MNMFNKLIKNNNNQIKLDFVKLKIFIVILLFAIFVIIGQFLINDANITSTSNRLLLPSSMHIFGTDMLGRDMFIRTLSGISTSLLCGILSTLLSILLAIIFACMAASERKIFKNFSKIVTTIILSVPSLVLQMIISLLFGKGAIGAIFAVGCTHFVTLSRILTTQIIEIINTDFYLIAKNIEKNSIKCICKHILPNISSSICSNIAILLPHAIIHESTLTFLGLGISPQIPAIGNILNDSYLYISTGQYYLSLFPGLFFCLTILILVWLSNVLSIKNK